MKKPPKAGKTRVPAPRYRIGDFVYSYQNPTEKRQINSIRKSTTPGHAHAYRLTLSDPQGRPRNSNWIDEHSLSKRRTR